MKRHGRCSIGGSASAVEIPLLASSLDLLGEAEAWAPVRVTHLLELSALPPVGRDPLRGHSQAGSLTGAVHLSKGNAGVLR